MIQKYRYMESSTASRLASINDKIPDIRKTLEMTRFLKEKSNNGEELETNYELNDTLYAKAVVEPNNKVFLWLGANVMLEYTTDEAIELLDGKLKTSLETKKICEEDLEFLRENITTMEVNTARVYNWDVQKRQEEKQAAAAE